jgi:hypothetical protein
MRMSSVLALVTVTWTFFCLRAAASGSAFAPAECVAEGCGLGELVALDAHLDGAERDFEEILLDFALHHGDLVHGLDAHLVAGSDVLEQMRLRVGVALIGAGAVGDDGLVEALLKLAAQARHAAFGFFRELLLRGAVLDGADGLAHLELEVLEQRGQLGFQLARPVAQLHIAFAGQFGAPG